MPNTATLGATPGDWSHFDLILGLREDLLPVICNHEAIISPQSSLKKLGKTPSQYNKKRFATGIIDWTQRKTKQEDISKWSAEPDLGICLQTRRIRAIDVDVPDPTISQLIEDFIENRVEIKLPKRMRSNSGKFLLAFALEGDLNHAEFPVNDDIVELLADGQQFIAMGTHESGVKYEWVNGLPLEFPIIEQQEFDDLWSALIEEFATGEETQGSGAVRKRGPSIEKEDSTADYLYQQGLVLGTDRNKSLLIKCPWNDLHTNKTEGDGSTVYFPAGTNGYELGHFKCLHAHCKGRKDEDFISALGVISNSFEVLTAKPKGRPWPAFRRDRNGRIYATINNVLLALGRSDICGYEIAFDQFKDEIVIADMGTSNWISFKDSHYVQLRSNLEILGFMSIGRELIRDAVLFISDKNTFDSAQLWLSSLVWDGVPRVTDFMRDRFGAEDTPYVRAVSNYLWSALAGRVIDPGVKADMAVILVGIQGAGKSSGVSAIAPDLQFFTEISFAEKEDDLARRMRGRLLAEISELRGLNSKDLEGIKAFITRQNENWIPKYREYAISYPRRTVFIGTTNSNEFLSDETGNRRFLPIKTNRVEVDAIRHDCLQLWAEAASMYQMLGVQWRGVEELSIDAHNEHMMVDPWQVQVRKWLDKPFELTGVKPRERDFLIALDVLNQAIGLETKHIGKREEMRISRTLGACGYKKERRSVNGQRIYVYLPNMTDQLEPFTAEVGHLQAA